MIKKDVTLLNKHLNDMHAYRVCIKNKILYYMDHPFPGDEPLQMQFGDKISNFRERQKESRCEIVKHNYVNLYDTMGDTLSFLTSIVDNYWDETWSRCFLDSSQCNPEKTQVFCENCQHWFHINCDQINSSVLDKNVDYICRKCRGIV